MRRCFHVLCRFVASQKLFMSRVARALFYKGLILS
jgi:hypothetical protein